MSDTRVIRKLMAGEVVCSVTESDAVDWLQGAIAKECVSEALSYCGFRLSYDQEETYFYASYANLDDKEDARALRSRLQEVVDLMHPIFQFMEFVSKANGEDVYPDIGHVYQFTTLLMSVEHDSSVAESLKSLSNTKFFKTVRSKNNPTDRLKTVLLEMAEHGLLATDNEALRFVVTGKFAHYLALYQTIVELDEPELMVESRGEQQGLGLLE
ncbi:hypothetical protein [Thiomicrorhabdus cannonii]|uniref:hypothetical protein n=1 Tax=Thiomicrorhabdus cannonii TaxID=2748011 RepID=UPI0015B99553|nr:hypothetical protein [Thiomicrorhabdus cannonii]